MTRRKQAYLTIALSLLFAQGRAGALEAQEKLSSAPVGGQVAQSATSTIKARSNLVIVDVVVTDHNHNPIRNLKLTDFQARESGVAQTIKSLDEHAPGATVIAPALPKMQPGVFTNYTQTPTNGPVNILLIDRLNTPLNDQPYLRTQLVSFIRSMKPGTRLAIFGLNNQLVYLQGFTSNPALLLAALESKKGGARQSPVLDPVIQNSQDSIAQNTQAMSDSISAGGGIGIPEEVLANLRQFEAQETSERTQVRVKLTLDAMNALARYLSAIPGRKNLVWFSGSFPISILPDSSNDLPDPFAVTADLSTEFRATTNLLSRSQVAVYPVDARGIQTLPMQDVSQPGGRYARDPRNYGKDNATFQQAQADEHSTMRQMARDTGGQAFVNTNGLAEAVTQAIELGSSYYTLTYSPTDANLDGKFRKIQIEIAQRGAELSYRRGYYAEGAGSARKQLTSSPMAPPSPERQAVASAMVRGAPGSTQILFKALVVPAGPATDDAVADGNVVSSAVKGPFRRYSVNYAAVPQDIALLTLGEGSYQAHLEFVVFVYNEDGALLNRFSQSLQAKLGTEDLKALSKGGIQFHQIVSVPAKGNSFFRIGIHDLNVDKIGTLEVPVSAVKNLPVTAPAVSAPQAPARVAPTLNNPPKQP